MSEVSLCNWLSSVQFIEEAVITVVVIAKICYALT